MNHPTPKLKALPANITINVNLQLNMIEALFLRATAMVYGLPDDAAAVRQLIDLGIDTGSNDEESSKAAFQLMQCTGVINAETMEPVTDPSRLPDLVEEMEDVLAKIQSHRQGSDN